MINEHGNNSSRSAQKSAQQASFSPYWICKKKVSIKKEDLRNRPLLMRARDGNERRQWGLWMKNKQTTQWKIQIKKIFLSFWPRTRDKTVNGEGVKNVYDRVEILCEKRLGQIYRRKIRFGWKFAGFIFLIFNANFADRAPARGTPRRDKSGVSHLIKVSVIFDLWSSYHLWS